MFPNKTKQNNKKQYETNIQQPQTKKTTSKNKQTYKNKIRHEITKQTKMKHIRNAYTHNNKTNTHYWKLKVTNNKQ